MKTIALLSLVGLIGCVKPQPVQAPADVYIEPIQAPQPESDVVANVPKWSVMRADPYNTEVLSSSRFEAVYGYGAYKITARVAKGLLFLECSNGTETISHCTKDGADFTYTCHGIPLTIKCEYIKIVNGVEEEIPKTREDAQEESTESAP